MLRHCWLGDRKDIRPVKISHQQSLKVGGFRRGGGGGGGGGSLLLLLFYSYSIDGTSLTIR